MKRIVFATLGAIVLLVVVVIYSSASAGGLLGSGDFIAKYKSTLNAVLVDVRTPTEFDAGHIPTATNIDYESATFESEIKKLDTSKTYFVYCRSGNRSAKSVAIMKGDGFQNIYELQGGISRAQELLN